MVWYGLVWCGVLWCVVVWCGVEWCGEVWCELVWYGVVWCGLVWRGKYRAYIIGGQSMTMLWSVGSVSDEVTVFGVINEEVVDCWVSQ